MIKIGLGFRWTQIKTKISLFAKIKMYFLRDFRVGMLISV